MAECPLICGAHYFLAISEFAEAKRERFASFLNLSNGIPSRDRFNHALAALRPEQFEKCLLRWISALHDISKEQIIPIQRQDVTAKLRSGH